MPHSTLFALLPSLAPWQWAALCFAAFCSGLSKTGISGIGIVSVVLFPQILPARAAVGSVLLLLIGSDAIAVLVYRRDAEWRHLWRLFPWTALGVVLGYFAMRWISDIATKHLIGAILLALVLFQFWQRARRQGTDESPADSPPHLVLSAVTGILAGFTTMVANAAGPIMILYLLSMRLPKIAFVGTAAWYFMLMNWLKVPFGLALGTINPRSLVLAGTLYPAALFGGLIGRPLVGRVRQQTFENIALALTFVGSLNLLR